MTTTNRVERFMLEDDIVSFLGVNPVQGINVKRPKQLKITITESDSTMEGVPEMTSVLPRADLVYLVKEKCSENEKQQFFEEISRASLDSIRTNNTEALRQLFLDWEYTVLWKINPGALERLNEQNQSVKNESGDEIDWRSFLSE